MAARSASSFFGETTIGSSFAIVDISFSGSWLVSSDVVIAGGGFSIEAGASTFWIEGRRSHCRKGHLVGGCR